MIRIRCTQSPIDNEILAVLDHEEAQGVSEVSARNDTLSLIVEKADGSLIGYAVFGRDEGNMVAVYYARSLVAGFGPMMMRQFFGVSQILGVPLRMHAQSIRDIAIKARMFGVDFAAEGVDVDGILQGVWS